MCFVNIISPVPAALQSFIFVKASSGFSLVIRLLQGYSISLFLCISLNFILVSFHLCFICLSVHCQLTCNLIRCHCWWRFSLNRVVIKSFNHGPRFSTAVLHISAPLIISLRSLLFTSETAPDKISHSLIVALSKRLFSYSDLYFLCCFSCPCIRSGIRSSLYSLSRYVFLLTFLPA